MGWAQEGRYRPYSGWEDLECDARAVTYSLRTKELFDFASNAMTVKFPSQVPQPSVSKLRVLPFPGG